MDTHLIWAAGFIDGEGTITIKRYRRKSKWNGTTKIHYQPYVSCGQVNKPANVRAIKKLQKLFGGSISQYVQQPKTIWLDTVSWAVVSLDAKKCVERLLPYLVIKNRQAKILLTFYKHWKITKGWQGTPKKELAKRDKLWAKMRSFNVKGKLRLQRLSEPTEKSDATV